MRELNLRPDLVLCSTSVRTRATLALVLLELGAPPPEISYEEGLYLASPSAILNHIRRTDKAVQHLLVVGHNPGLHALALELTGAARREDMADLAIKFPTAALANMTFDLDSWRNVKAASGRLVRYMTPRRLT